MNDISSFYVELSKVHAENFPEWRFGEFISNFELWCGRNIRYINDDAILEKLKFFVKEQKIHEKFVNKQR